MHIIIVITLYIELRVTMFLQEKIITFLQDEYDNNYYRHDFLIATACELKDFTGNDVYSLSSVAAE